MRKNHRISIIIGLLFMGAAVVLWAKPADKQPVSTSPEKVKVLLDTVQEKVTRRSTRFAGVTQARDRAVLSFSVPARVASRQVESGSIVRQGQILARMDEGEYRNAVTLAQATYTELQAQLKQAKRDRDRMARLAASDVIPVADFEQVNTHETVLKFSLQAAAAKLKEAQRLLDETVLKAPFNGTVTGVFIQPGEWGVPGKPAIELTGDGDIELLVQVPESLLDCIETNQLVEVELPFADNRRVPGRISSIAKAALTAGRLFPLKVDLGSEPGVIAGMTAQLVIDLSTGGVLTVPLAAVINPGASQPYLFVFKESRVVKRIVTIGGIIDDRIVVSGDIQSGDRVVISGQSQLTDGEMVEAAL